MADSSFTSVEKRPGYDWVCIYQRIDEELSRMEIFGCMTADDALKESHNSLSSCELLGIEPDYQILGIIRSDKFDEIK